MKKNIFHIILSLLLTFAVTDYIWYDLLQGDKLAIELEAESEKEASSEEVAENKTSESKDLDWDYQYSIAFLQNESLALNAGLIKLGNAYGALSIFNSPKLFLLNCQFKIHC